jgi:Zn-dependent membrane protease YugP
LLAAGLWLGMQRLIVLAMILFSLSVVLQLLNLPVELDASRRGRSVLDSAGLVSPGEGPILARIMNAAAWTSVAGTLSGGFARFCRADRLATETVAPAPPEAGC